MSMFNFMRGIEDIQDEGRGSRFVRSSIENEYTDRIPVTLGSTCQYSVLELSQALVDGYSRRSKVRELLSVDSS